MTRTLPLAEIQSRTLRAQPGNDIFFIFRHRYGIFWHFSPQNLLFRQTPSLFRQTPSLFRQNPSLFRQNPSLFRQTISLFRHIFPNMEGGEKEEGASEKRHL